MRTIIKRNGTEVPFDEKKIFNAIYAANKAVEGEKMQSYDIAYLVKKVIERLDGEKTAAQADLIAKRKAVAEIHTLIDTEGAKIAEQIKALKEENAGYEQFLN